MAQTWRLEPLTDLQELFTELVEDLIGGATSGEGRMPRTELRRVSDGYRLLVALPGMSREDVELAIEGQTLVVEGERRAEDPPADARPLRRERWTGRFRRTVRLPEQVDAARVTARLRQGILEVTLPQPAQAQPKQIAIEVETEEGA